MKKKIIGLKTTLAERAMISCYKAVFAATLCALGASAQSQPFWSFVSGQALAQSRIDFDFNEPGMYSPTVSGNAPPAFDLNLTENLTTFDGLGYAVSIGSQTYRAASNVDGVPGVGYKFASSESRIENFDMVIGDPQDPFFTFSFDSLERICFTEGNDPETYNGHVELTMTIENGQMTYLGNPIEVPTNPSYIHEFVAPGGQYDFFVQANTGYHGILLSGSDIPGGPDYILIDIASGSAGMEAWLIPEPSTLIAVCLGGFVLLALRRRRA